MQYYTPFISEYLERLYDTTQLALRDHHQIFAVRFDLRFPDDSSPTAANPAATDVLARPDVRGSATLPGV